MKSAYEQEIESGERFGFGENWARFLEVLDEERIEMASASLQAKLGAGSLTGKTFLDAGSGSGLFSLAARRLGARVHSFDFDPYSVACTQELRARYFPDDSDWRVEEASVLDRDYIDNLEKFDIVYSWGVLHHTGNMWQALENIDIPVAPGGQLFIAIYNDQGIKSRLWKVVKKNYNGNAYLRPIWKAVFWPYFVGLRRLYRRIRHSPLERGMDYHSDMVDWLGGFPFEVAKPDEIFYFFRTRGYTLCELKTCAGRLGCNEFVFSKRDTDT